MDGRSLIVATVGAAALVLTIGPGCSRGSAQTVADDAAPKGSAGSLVTAPSATAPGAPREGMVWVPAGVLVAGTPEDKAPRIPEEELPGVETPLGGFYIDELPYPNEPGAIPLASVSREDAARLCETKNKRLCTELEWERACKGPKNTVYEYGDAYKANQCATGVSVEQAARRPSGERGACRSGFGAREMHGGVWEWTDSVWERGEPTRLAVLRGGNASAGEIVGRCANALARPAGTKSPTMGFRCCAGPRNDARVELAAVPRKGPAIEAVGIPDAHAPWGPVEWRWRPVPNEELRIRGECREEAAFGTTCTCRIYRPTKGDTPESMKDVTAVETGKALCGIVQPAADPKDLRMLYMDGAAKSRTVRYAYGRVVVSVAR